MGILWMLLSAIDWPAKKVDNEGLMSAIITILFALFGVSIGSFLNVLIDRLPADKSILFPPSHCDACQRRLAPTDLIPVFSFLWQRGRCRYCGARIASRVFWVEAGTGLLFAFSYYYYGLSANLVMLVFYGCLFLVIGVIDLEHRLILNKIVYPSLPVALGLAALLSPAGLINSLLGGAAGMALLLAISLVTRGGMGMGDVKMAALIGVATGFPMVFAALFLGIVLGGVVAVCLVLLRLKKRKEFIPFGPFLSLASIGTIVWGKEIVAWYMAMF